VLRKEDVKNKRMAIYDPDRKAIFIHQNQLAGSQFKVGDRFSVKKGRQELFALTLIKDDDGDVVFDKTGICVHRTRRVDMLLRGIFDDYVIDLEPGNQDAIKIRPLEMVLKGNRL